jgi:hypothetical protein
MSILSKLNCITTLKKIIFYFKQNCQGQLAVAESRLAMKKLVESVPVLDSNTELDIFKPEAKEIEVSKGLKKVVI